MEIKYLRDFVILAQTGNFMEAADILYCSQSALSKHIQSIEKELGVPLFERTTRKVKISKFGELLLPYAKEITQLHEKFTAAIQNSLDSEQDMLTIGAIPALAQYHITEVMVQYKKTRSQSTLNVIQAGSGELRDFVQQKKCELAFIRLLDEEYFPEMVEVPFAADTLAAVVPVNHPLAKKKTIELLSLANEDLLLLEKNTLLYYLSINACEKCGFTPRIAHTDHMLENLVDMVAKGLGIALLMKPLALHLATPGTVVVDLEPMIKTTIKICYLKESKLSLAANHFLLCAKSVSDINRLLTVK